MDSRGWEIHWCMWRIHRRKQNIHWDGSVADSRLRKAPWRRFLAPTRLLRLLTGPGWFFRRRLLNSANLNGVRSFDSDSVSLFWTWLEMDDFSRPRKCAGATRVNRA